MKKFFILILIFAIYSPTCFSGDRDNLINNPGFENGRQGWEDMWVREKGTGSMKIISYTGKPGGNVLEVKSSGTKDWSIGQKARLDVFPGEVYAFYGWVKCEKVEGGAQLSVVLRDKEEKVIDWLYGIKEFSGTHGWKRMEGRFIIPKGCVQIQFRITGQGKGTTLWDDLSLFRIKKVSGVLSSEMEEVSISAMGTTCSFSPHTHLIRIYFKGHSRVYSMKGFGNSVFLTEIKKENNTLLIFIQNIHFGDIIASISIVSHNEISLTLTGSGVLESPFAFPDKVIAGESLYWVIPQNEGLLIPADDPYYAPPWGLQLYQGHGGLSMPFIGLTGTEEGIIIISETPDDNYVKFHKPEETENNVSGWSFVWQPRMGKWDYIRKIRIQLIESGGYVGIAKAYRTYAKNKGLLVTLQKKRESVPAVDLLIGSANIWWWKKAEQWAHETECGAIAGEIKKAGLTRVIWSNQASPRAIKDMNNLQFLTGRYDIYQDVWDPSLPFKWFNTEGWPEDLVLNPDGSWRKGWVHRIDGKEYPGGIICSQRGFEQMKKKVAEDLKTHPYHARFIDTTTASPLQECYHPDHPLSRSGDREYKSKILGYISGHFGMVTGSETGIDWAVPYVHYFEGMMSIGPYRLRDAGYDLVSYMKPQKDFLRFQLGSYYRIPLFELVYHDCVTSFWYWGDSSNRLPEFWKVRDLFNLLYGTGPLYIIDPEKWDKDKNRFIESYSIATATSRNTGYTEMLIHRFITEDHTVQYTQFANNTEVWVNFGDKPYTRDNGDIIEPKGYSLIIPGD